MRRCEIVALNVVDLDFTEEGVKVHIRRSKTDPKGGEEQVGVPYGSDPATCPIRAVNGWLRASGIESSALFRGVSRHCHLGRRLHGQDVARIVRTRRPKLASMRLPRRAGLAILFPLDLPLRPPERHAWMRSGSLPTTLKPGEELMRNSTRSPRSWSSRNQYPQASAGAGITSGAAHDVTTRSAPKNLFTGAGYHPTPGLTPSPR